MSRRSGGLYPLWVGVLSLAGLGVFWTLSTTSPELDPPADAEIIDAKVTDSGTHSADIPRLRWIISGREPPDASVLAGCLARSQLTRARVTGSLGSPLVITYPGQPLPTMIQPGTSLTVDTPLLGDHRRGLMLHLAIAACLRVKGATLYDPALERRWSNADWPLLGRTGGLPVPSLIMIDAQNGTLQTRGLKRLGLIDLSVQSADTPAARRFLSKAVVALFVAETPDSVLTVDTHAFRLAPGQNIRQLLDTQGAPFSIPTPTAPVVTQPVVTQPVVTQPKPPTKRPIHQKRRQPRTKPPRDPAPHFMPDYR